MGCYLRVCGTDLDVDRLIIAAGLDDAADVLKAYRRGEPRFPKSQPDGPRNATSGLNICISTADFRDFEKQIKDAIETLHEERELVMTLQSFDGVDDVALDFGIARHDCVVQFDHLPAELVRLAGELGLSIEISHYPVSSLPETKDDSPA